MWHYIIGGLALHYLLGQQKKEETQAQTPADPFAMQIPVDAHCDANMANVVRNCFQQGTEQDLIELAHAIGLEFPVARNTLIGRAYEIRALAAAQAQRQAQAQASPQPPASPQPVESTGETRIVPQVENGKLVARAAPVRPLSKAEIAVAENKAAIEATANGKSTLVEIHVPTEVVEKPVAATPATGSA